jgi:hypothetical protein
MYLPSANKNTPFPELSRVSDVFMFKIKCLYIVRKLRLSCFKTAVCVLNPLFFLFNLLNYLSYADTV